MLPLAVSVTTPLEALTFKMKKIKLTDELELLVEMMPKGLSFSNDTEKYVCAYMCYYATDDSNKNGAFKMPMTALTNALKIHRNTASIAVASLINKGYFEVIKKGSNLTHDCTSYQCLLKSICALSISSNISSSFSSSNNSNSSLKNNIIINSNVTIEPRYNANSNNNEDKNTDDMTTVELEAIQIARDANFNSRKKDNATTVANNTLSIEVLQGWIAERFTTLQQCNINDFNDLAGKLLHMVRTYYPKVATQTISIEDLIANLKCAISTLKQQKQQQF